MLIVCSLACSRNALRYAIICPSKVRMLVWVRGSREKPSREKPMLVLQEDTGVHSIDALAAAVEPRRLVRVYRSQFIV